MRSKLHDIIFGTTTKGGKAFDVMLLILILLSVLNGMFESIPLWGAEYEKEFYVLEWFFTILFTIEYILRIIISPRPLRYIFSWWGVIDLLSIIPTFITPLVSGYDSLRVVRALRLLRIFRILKLSRFTSESQSLGQALRASYYKIMVFLFFVVMMMILAGTLMYVVEGGGNGFESIPDSIYWAIVTTTTVGYGDVIPLTVAGKMLSSVMMIIGYSIIAVPTGIISVEIGKSSKKGGEDDRCPKCNHLNISGSIFCNQCGSELTGS